MAICRELNRACWAYNQRNSYEMLAERIFNENNGINEIMVNPLGIIIHRKKS